MDMSDDPSVFNFDVSSGVIYGPTEVLFDLPVGPALPRLKQLNPKIIYLLIKVPFCTKEIFAINVDIKIQLQQEIRLTLF